MGFPKLQPNLGDVVYVKFHWVYSNWGSAHSQLWRQKNSLPTLEVVFLISYHLDILHFFYLHPTIGSQRCGGDEEIQNIVTDLNQSESI